jgi:hypothetical protein
VGRDYRGWLGLGNLRANGHPSGGPGRQLYCRSCTGYFLEAHGTLLHGKRVAVELIVRVLTCLAEGLGIRATARVFEVDPNTVLQWLVEAAEQLQAFSAFFLCDVHVRQLQLDELYAVLRGVRDGEISAENALKRLERSRHWVWTVIDPESTLLLVTEVGPRTLEMAHSGTSLRQPLRVSETTNGSGSAKLWRPCTPAMAAGLTDHVWTRQEVLMFRVPPWPQPHAV